MKILFIFTNIDTRNLRHYPIGVGLLSAYLKRHNHETSLLYVQDGVSKGRLLARVREEGPDLIAFSTVTLQWRYTKKYARMIRKRFNIPIICGGIHPTFMPEEVLAEPSVDMVCIGEGEAPLLDVVNALESGSGVSGIANIWSRDDKGRIVRNPVREPLRNMDELPFRDFDIMPIQDLINESKSEPVFITGRGCPYNCRYCSNTAIKKLYQGKGEYMRQRSPENVIREIGEMKSRYRFETLNFYDESFGYDREWLKRFCDMYKQEFHMSFGALIRAETMDRSTLRLMAEAGLAIIYLGVESGNDDIRRNVMGRKVGKQQIIQTCRDAQAEGVQVWTYNMVGLPGETVETIRESIELNRIIDPHFVSISIFQPLPGTPLYDECVRNRYLKKPVHSATNFYDGASLNLPTISRKKLMAGFREFQAVADEIKLSREARGERIYLADI